MSKFFTKKKVIMLIFAAAIIVMVGVLVGSNIVNNIKAKEKVAEKAKVEKTIEERKEINEKIEKVRSDNDNLNREIEEEYSDEYKEYLKLTDEEKAQVEVVPRKEKIDYSELETIKEEQEENLEKKYVIEDDDNKEQEDNDEEEEEDDEEKDDKEEENVEVLPKYFNLKDEIDIKVESQGSFGLCWDFASVKCVETNLALTQGKYYDLSESHIDYMTSKLLSTKGSRDENGGGNFSDVKDYNMDYKGFVLEEDVPLNVYEDFDYNTFYNIPAEDIYISKYVNFPALCKKYDESEEEYNKKLKDFQAAVKTHIMNYGSLYTVIEAPDYGVNHYIKNYDDKKDGRGSHAVSIVGWDDEYSRDNFTSPNGNKPERDGAYIALNSWGDWWGEDGYFYISYEDCCVHSQLSGVVSINNESDLIQISSLGKKAREYVKNCMSEKIVTIDGKEYIAKNTFGNQVDLSNLELESEDLSDFQIFIENAFSIDLSNNNLDSIDGLENYIKKDSVTINLSDNNIKDVSCLKNTKISSLVLDGNYGVTGYEQLNISYRLSLENCGITTADGIEKLQIETLNLSGNPLDELSKLSEIENIYYIELKNCNLESLDEIKELLKNESIVYIDLSGNNLKDISGLENATIYDLVLADNPEITDFEPLRKNSDIVRIDLSGCDIKDAKDVLTAREVGLEEAEVLEEEEFEGEELFGVTYTLSNNKDIKNLKALTNATSLVLKECDLGDISELKELKYLKVLNLEHNYNLSGDLSGMNLDDLIVNDCNLTNDFNMFNIDSVGYLSIRENDITSIDNFRSRVKWMLYIDSTGEEFESENDLYIEEFKPKGNNIVEIDIPDEDGLVMNVTQYLKSNDVFNRSINVNGRRINSGYMIIPVTEDTVITYGDYYSGDTTITFKVNKNLENDGIEVTYNPYLARQNADDEVNPDLLKVANTYGNFVTKQTNNYEINDEVYEIPWHTVERTYDDEKHQIFVSRKYYSLVTQGDFSAKFTAGKASAKAKSEEEQLCEDLTPPDEFEEDFPVLTFTSEELYNIAKDYWDGIYVRADDKLLTIELKSRRYNNGTGVPMYIPRKLLYDVKGLAPMIENKIYILMDDENGNEKITKEDWEIFDNFENLTNVNIIVPKGKVGNIEEYMENFFRDKTVTVSQRNI